MKAGRKPKCDHAALAAALRAGELPAAAADRLGVAVSTVYRVARTARVPPRKRTRPPAQPPRGPSDAELDATMAAQIARGRPPWWRSERQTSVIFELAAAGRLFPWRK